MTLYEKKILQIFEKLKLPLPIETMYYIIYKSDFSSQYDLRNVYYEKNRNKQIGCGKSTILKFKNTEFKIFIFDDGDSINYSLHKKNDYEEDPCILIIIYKKEKNASIYNLSYHDKCFTKNQGVYLESIGNIPSGNLLMELGLYIIDSVKNHYKLK